jgi:hypothetical protein
MKITPAPPVDVVRILPSFAGRQKISVRLHPRTCEPEPDIYSSKLGGHFLWPEDEPWPACDVPEVALLEDYVWTKSPEGYDTGDNALNIWPKDHPKHNDAYVGILQLKAEEFPEIEFPSGKNLFQFLWCPRDHVCTDWIVGQVFWRKIEEVGRPLPRQPKPTFPDKDLTPSPCCIYPERVTEYPDIFELTAEEIKALEEMDEDGEVFYGRMLSVAPGIKFGGYVDWIQEPEVPVCECGHEMEHLLTVASAEFDPDNAERWCPIEDLPIWKQAEGSTYHQAKEVHEAAAMVQVAAGLTIGDCGSIYLFICRRCKEWPVKTVFQCS